jgi:outer membrane protein TolC
MKAFVAIIFFVLSGALLTFAGVKTKVNSPLQAIALAEKNNPSLKRLQAQIDVTNAELVIAKEWWKPDFQLFTGGSFLNGNALNANGLIFTEVQQRSFKAGIGTNATWDPYWGTANVRTQELILKAKLKSVEYQRAQILADVLKSYFLWVSSKAKDKAFDELKIGLNEYIQQFKGLVDQGLAYNSDYLLLKSRMSHFEMLQAKNQNEIELNETYLKQNLGVDQSMELHTTFDVEGEDLARWLSQDKLLGAEAYTPSNIDALEIKKEAAEQALKMMQNELWYPSVQLNTYSSFFGGQFTPVDPTSALNLSLAWTLPGGRLSSKGKVKSAMAKKGEVQLLLDESKAKYQADLHSYSVETWKKISGSAKEATTLASTALAECVQRQKVGTIRPSELLAAYAQFHESQMSELEVVQERVLAFIAYLAKSGVDYKLYFKEA